MISQKRKRRGVGGLEPPSREEELKKEAKSTSKVVFLFEGAQLEAAKLGSQICLLNVDDHKGHLAKHGKDVSSYRPDSFISRC